ncbi:hypothetical protein C8J56DRAFT_1101718 [Mycena floridula]|nr:hypothetical protein C8J56DRAFT_1101718 [Mycena floridula]
MVMLLGLAVAVMVQLALALDRAQCNSTAGFQWSYNQYGHDPCTIGSYVGGVCETNGVFNIPALAEDTVYTSPLKTDADNRCICSTVYYSLLSLCAACQLKSYSSWSHFSTNCTLVYLMVDVPPFTAIPNWAYQNVTVKLQSMMLSRLTTKMRPQANDPFNISVALADSRLEIPETTASIPTRPQKTATSNDTTASKKLNLGGIIGGIVAGLSAVAVGLILFWWRRRSIRDKEGFVPLEFGITPFEGLRARKLYDPSDPSTFPPSIRPSSFHTTITQPEEERILPPIYAHPLYRPPGMYKGLAEPC